MRGWLAIALIFGGCGGDEAHKLSAGAYSRTTTQIAQDDCAVAGMIGMTDSSYGRLTVTDTQVTHTMVFTNEIFVRSGNKLTRMAVEDRAATGTCVITESVQENGTITADDTVEVQRHLTHVIKSGDCSMVLRTMCMSTFTYKLSKVGP